MSGTDVAVAALIVVGVCLLIVAIFREASRDYKDPPP